MNIPRYWAKAETFTTIGGQDYHFIAYKGSDESLLDAQARAQETLAKRIARKERGEPLGSYPKHGAPLREEIIEEVMNGSQRIAIITRNAAGSLVLNTAKVMFIDIDLNQAAFDDSKSFGQILKELFGLSKKEKSKPRDQQVLEAIRKWHAEHSHFVVRIYRTRAGFRLLVTHDLFDPNDAQTSAIMKALNTDARYRRLCEIQSCFRARLTPKYWRLRLPRPPARYPWDNAAQELLQREWEISYHQAIDNYDVCRYVETLGQGAIHPDAQIVMDLHDKYVMSESDKKLA